MGVDFFLDAEQKMFRESIDGFMTQHVEPHFSKWEKEGKVDREFFKVAGNFGLLGLTVDGKYGGLGLNEMYSLIFMEQASRHNMPGAVLSISAHAYLAMNYLVKGGSEFLKEKYLVPSVKGELVGALAMTEPGAGSDLGALRTKAVRDGDFYVVNGSKTFITNGVYSNYVVTAVKMENGTVSLLVIDNDSLGFTATKLHKLGLHSSDTAELGFNNVRVPVANLIGEEGKGFYYMMESLQTERLAVAWSCIGGCMGAMDITLEYIKTREAFGKPISKMQVIRHKLAELQTEIEATRAFTYLTTQRFCNGENIVKEASMLKMKTSDLQKIVIDECLQFFGGYGFIEEYPIARLYRDNRVNPIYAGTNEIMKEIISKTIIEGVSYKKVY